MRKALTIVNLLACLGAVPALADEDCFVPMADWQPRSAVAALAAQNGWQVRRIKIDDGCYAVHGTDAKGRKIEAKLNPQTLKILDLGPGDDDREHNSDVEKSDH